MSPDGILSSYFAHRDKARSLTAKASSQRLPFMCPALLRASLCLDSAAVGRRGSKGSRPSQQHLLHWRLICTPLPTPPLQPADTTIGDEGRRSWNRTALALQSSPLQSPMLCRKHEAQQNCSTSALNPLFAISLMRKKHFFFFPWDLFQKIFLILLRSFVSVQDTNYVFCFVFLFVLDFYKNACERSLCSWSYKACPSTETSRSLGSKARSHI